MGGCVRDWLLGKTPLDWDITVDIAPRLMLPIIQEACGRRPFIELDAELEIYRLQLEAGINLDVARLAQDDIYKDLHRRDLTINAMAVAVSDGKLIDPLNGYADLQAGILRVPNQDNLASDPVRVLRAFRFAATLNFQIDPETLDWLQTCAPQLVSVAGERLLAEWHKLLISGRAAPVLKTMQRLHVLGWTLGDTDINDSAALERVAQMECLLERPPHAVFQRLAACVTADAFVERPSQSTLLLAALLMDASLEQVQNVMQRLPLSRRQTHLITSILRGYRHFARIFAERPQRADFYRGIRDMKEAWPGLMWLLAGDPNPLLRTGAQDGLEFYWNLTDAPPPRFIRGQDVLALPGMRPGPRVAELLAEVEEAIALGQITSRPDALAWLKQRHAAEP